MKIRPFLVLPAAGLLALVSGCAVETEPVPLTDAEASATAEPAALVNDTCPLMGGDVDPAVTTEWNGKTVGFCCAQCIPEWKELTEQEKAEKLAAAQAGETENDMRGDHDHADHNHGDA